jgi:putative endonuclease
VTREAAERRGRRGELAAKWWLRLQGWRILDARVKTRVGEVDLIARRGAVLSFVEVKTRRRAAHLDHAIDAYRLRRVAAAAHLLMPNYAQSGDGVRIDVILIAPWTWPRIIEDARLE